MPITPDYATTVNRLITDQGCQEVHSDFLNECEKNSIPVDLTAALGIKNTTIRRDLSELGFEAVYTGGGCHHFQKNLGYKRGHTWFITIANPSLSWNLIVDDPKATFSLGVVEGRIDDGFEQMDSVFSIELDTRNDEFGKTSIQRLSVRTVKSIVELEVPDGAQVDSGFPDECFHISLENTPNAPDFEI